MKASLRIGPSTIRIFPTALSLAYTALVWGFAFSLFTPNGFADEHELITPAGEPVKDYEQRILFLRKGDVVRIRGTAFLIEEVLSDGRQFLVVGSQDFVFESQGDVIRVPLGRNRTTDELADSSATRFWKGYFKLKGSDVPMVEVDERKSHAPDYVVMKKLPIRYSLYELLRGIGRARNVTEAEKQKAFDRLVDFARATWQFKSIGDFSYNQLGWLGEERGWVLFDFQAADTERAGVGDKTHVFAKEFAHLEHLFPKLPKELKERIDRAIQEERDRRFRDPLYALDQLCFKSNRRP